MNEKLKIIIITEDEPFYLAEAFRYFFSQKLDGYDITLAIILNYFHTKRTSTRRIKIRDVFKVFGPVVFIRALLRFITGRFKRSKKVSSVFLEQGIPVKKRIKDINAHEILEEVKRHNPDILIAVGVNSLFHKPLRDLARFGCINVHTGIKPEHRGRASIFWALADGHNETGITVHFVDDGIDTGHIITTHRYEITERSLDRLLRDLRLLSMDALIDALTIIRNKNMSRSHPCSYPSINRPLPDITDLKVFVQRGNKIF